MNQSDLDLGIFLGTRDPQKVQRDAWLPSVDQIVIEAYDRDTERMRVFLRGQIVAFRSRKQRKYEFSPRQLEIAIQAAEVRERKSA